MKKTYFLDVARKKQALRYRYKVNITPFQPEVYESERRGRSTNRVVQGSMRAILSLSVHGLASWNPRCRLGCEASGSRKAWSAKGYSATKGGSLVWALGRLRSPRPLLAGQHTGFHYFLQQIGCVVNDRIFPP